MHLLIIIYLLLQDYIICTFLMNVFVGGVVGSFLLAWLWTMYSNAVSNQTEGRTTTLIGNIITLLFVDFVSNKAYAM